MARATITPFSTGTITGTVTFVEVAGGVQVTYALENCPAGPHPTHIHEGTGCASATQQGMHWGPARGENIGPNGGEITCDSQMRGTLVYMRPNTPANTRWTIGDNTAASDVVGHPVVVHGATSDERHGCGVIQLVN
jgi:Cu/Zn superoxide dismutase